MDEEQQERRKEVVTYKQVSDLVRDSEKNRGQQFQRLYDKLDENLKDQRVRDETQDSRLTTVEGHVGAINERHETEDADAEKSKSTRLKVVLWAGAILVTSGGAAAILRLVLRSRILGGITP